MIVFFKKGIFITRRFLVLYPSMYLKILIELFWSISELKRLVVDRLVNPNVTMSHNKLASAMDTKVNKWMLQLNKQIYFQAIAAPFSELAQNHLPEKSVLHLKLFILSLFTKFMLYRTSNETVTYICKKIQATCWKFHFLFLRATEHIWRVLKYILFQKSYALCKKIM